MELKKYSDQINKNKSRFLELVYNFCPDILERDKKLIEMNLDSLICNTSVTLQGMIGTAFHEIRESGNE